MLISTMLRKLSIATTGTTIIFLGTAQINVSRTLAASIAIVRGTAYTSDLATNLTNAGETVTTIFNYDADSLAAYDAVIHYGNSFVDMAALDSYVQSGGTLIETPWFWTNFAPPSNLQIFSNGGDLNFNISYPGVTVLEPNDPFLDGVNIPAETGGFDIGRSSGNIFASGVTEVAAWSDNDTAFIGYKSLGLGTIIGINMQVITSDTAYTVINQPWATQLFVNAANVCVTNCQTVPVPESDNLFGLLGVGAVGALSLLRKQKYKHHV